MMSKGRNTYLYFFKVASIPIVIVIGVWLLGYWVYSKTILIQDQQKHVSEIVHNTIQALAQKDLLLPDVVFIHVDSSGQQGLNETLTNQIATMLTEKYLNNNSTTFQDIDFHPFYVLPNETDSFGNYMLTQTQLTDLKNHLDFLTKQIDLEADEVKEEVGRDIDRLNTWVSIWIGILGFFGILIPIFINYELRKDTDQAKLKSDEAEKKSDDASKKLAEAKPQIDKVDGLEETVKGIQEALPGITEQSSTAKSDAREAVEQAQTAITSAKKNENLLSVLQAVSMLRDFDVGTLRFIRNKKAFLIQILRKFHTEVQNGNDHPDHEIIKDSVRQLGLKLHYISLLKFSEFDYTEDLNEFSNFILENLKKEMNKDVFENILSKLNELIEKLKNSRDIKTYE